MSRAFWLVVIACATVSACTSPMYPSRWFRTGLASGYRPFKNGCQP